MSTRKKVFSGIFAFAIIAVLAVVVFQANRGSRADTQKGPPAVPVSVVAVGLKTVPVRLYAIGNVEPYTTVAVKARVDGQILSVHFKEGDEVRQGSVLFEIDPRPVRRGAQAGAGEPAQGQGAARPRGRAGEALQGPARQELHLGRRLRAGPHERRNRRARRWLRTRPRSRAAKLSLEYCTIRSPVTGYAGRIQIQQGNLVKANDTNPLVTVNQVVPIYASFSVPEQNITDVRKYTGGRRAQGGGDLHEHRARRRSRASSPSSTTAPTRRPARSSSRPSSRTPTRRSGPDSSSTSC